MTGKPLEDLMAVREVAREASEAARSAWRKAGKPTTDAGLHGDREHPLLTALLRCERHLLACEEAVARKTKGGQVGVATAPDRAADPGRRRLKAIK